MPLSIRPSFPQPPTVTSQETATYASSQLIDHWRAWAAEGSPDESRDRAFTILQDCLRYDGSELKLFGLGLTSLPDRFPPGLRGLEAERNRLREFPQNLPSSLEVLNISSNELTSLGVLPPRLCQLNVAGNDIEVVHALPHTLEVCDVSGNALTYLPELPPQLRKLRAADNVIVAVSELPAGLTELNLTGNLIESLPELPGGLFRLEVGCNYLSALPTLPDTLIELQADLNQLDVLPALPDGLEELDVDSNFLSELPETPRSLINLYVNFNHLRRLPDSIRRPDCATVVTAENNPLPASDVWLLAIRNGVRYRADDMAPPA